MFIFFGQVGNFPVNSGPTVTFEMRILLYKVHETVNLYKFQQESSGRRKAAFSLPLSPLVFRSLTTLVTGDFKAIR